MLDVGASSWHLPTMLLIYPPVAKPSEVPAGIARLAGFLHGHGLPCTLLDANIEGLCYLLSLKPATNDTWSRRALRSIKESLDEIRSVEVYSAPSRYRRRVDDINRVLEIAGRQHGITLGLANYADPRCSPLRSSDLLCAAEYPEENIYYPYFAPRLSHLVEEEAPTAVGISLNYMSQAVCTFAMAGFLKKRYPELSIVLGGGLVTSWLRNPAWRDPFSGLIDRLVAGQGEKPLLAFLGRGADQRHHASSYAGLPLRDYLAPGFILPYAASSGCYWKKCSFCPERSEGNPYHSLSPQLVLCDIASVGQFARPVLLHLLDNAISPILLRELSAWPPGIPWYGFARISQELADEDFCRNLRKSGCVMLKLGLESGDRHVLESMNKGIDLALVSRVFAALRKVGILTYVYLLFGTPEESIAEARNTLNFIVRHQEAIGFLNPAIFNLPVCSKDAGRLVTRKFYEGDLTLYADFKHPRGWQREMVRNFLDREFKRHPAIAAILRRDPFLFTSNHAPFFHDSVRLPAN